MWLFASSFWAITYAFLRASRAGDSHRGVKWLTLASTVPFTSIAFPSLPGVLTVGGAGRFYGDIRVRARPFTAEVEVWALYSTVVDIHFEGELKATCSTLFVLKGY